MFPKPNHTMNWKTLRSWPYRKEAKVTEECGADREPMCRQYTLQESFCRPRFPSFCMVGLELRRVWQTSQASAVGTHPRGLHMLLLKGIKRGCLPIYQICYTQVFFAGTIFLFLWSPVYFCFPAALKALTAGATPLRFSTWCLLRGAQ